MELSVPFSKLIVSCGNVRRTNPLVDIPILAAQIRSQGLLQNLVVREADDGKYRVVDGRRRHAAIRMLARSGEWPRDGSVPVMVLSPEHDDIEVGLAANLGRVDMHPADTFEAFRKLCESEGASAETIAARFGYAASTVRGFLKLANASPRLMRAFRNDEIALVQMQALAITDDHKRQEAAFFDQPDYLRTPENLRRTLMAGRLRGSDRSVRFVGLEAYEAAGGAVTRDLFDTDGSVYVENSGLVQRLLAGKLEAEAQKLRALGWKWVEVHPDFTPSDTLRHGKVSKAAHGFDADSKAARLYAGAMLGIDREGKLVIVQGLLKPEDAKALAKARQKQPAAVGPANTDRAAAADPGGDPDRAGNGQAPKTHEHGLDKNAPAESGSGVTLSAPLVEDLSVVRTAALRAEVAVKPAIALALAAHDLALPVFYEPWDGEQALTSLSLPRGDIGLIMADDASPAVKALNETVLRWKPLLPARAFDLWPWLLKQDTAVLCDLLAIALAHCVDAVHHRHEKREPRRVRSGARLAATLSLDMTRYWQAGEAFLARMSKASILAAIAEAASPAIARQLDRGGKADLVRAASRKLGSWLPKPLRTLAVTEEGEEDSSDEMPEHPQVEDADSDANEADSIAVDSG